jgi:hypothetical protein
MFEERDGQHDAVDALIDAAARSLTHQDPPVSLRTHVRASIATPPPRRVRVWVPATVAIVIAVAAWSVMRKPAVAPRDSAPPVMSRSAVPGTPEPRAQSSPLARVDRRSAPESVRPWLVVLSAERVTPIDDPLPAIAPIEIEQVPTSAMAAIERIPAPVPLSVDAITIERLFE